MRPMATREDSDAINRSTLPLLLAFAFAWLGTLDAAWLLVVDASGAADVCSGAGCAAVLGSRYAHVAGVPLALLGLVYYALLALGAAARAARPASRVVGLSVVTLATMGVATSALLTGVQAFILHAFCPFCLASATITVLVALALVLGRGPRRPIRSKVTTVLVLLELATVAVGLVAWRREAAARATQLASFGAPINVDVSHALTFGNPGAPVRVIAFLDYDCTRCREAWQTLSAVFRDSGGRFRIGIFAYRLPGHTGSDLAAKAAEVADERGLFAQMHERLMTAPRLDLPMILSMGQQVGVPMGPLVTRLQGPGDSRWLRASLEEAQRLGVDKAGVPFVLVDGRPLPSPITAKLVEGALSR